MQRSQVPPDDRDRMLAYLLPEPRRDMKRQGNRVNEYVTNGSSVESMGVLDSQGGGQRWTF
jgi:hypothetical protein